MNLTSNTVGRHESLINGNISMVVDWGKSSKVDQKLSAIWLDIYLRIELCYIQYVM